MPCVLPWTTPDELVIPKRLRDELGIVPGPVEVVRDGAGVRIEPLSDPTLERVGARLVIPATGSAVIDDDVVRDAPVRAALAGSSDGTCGDVPARHERGGGVRVGRSRRAAATVEALSPRRLRHVGPRVV